MVEIKFCGMMRAEDATAAANLGAAYVGVILAEGPRTLTDAGARAVLDGLPSSVKRVGVFGRASMEDIGRRALALQLDVVQLHGDPTADTIAELRRLYAGDIWAVVRIASAEIPRDAAELFRIANGVVLDARVAGKLGGSGVTLPWAELRDALARVRKGGGARVILAGGLSAENVGEAIETLDPDVVDVSSGIESAVGIKDPGKMRAFRHAVRHSRVGGAPVR